jgi:hypothetical protein
MTINIPPEILLCDCHHAEHQLIIRKFPEDHEIVYLEVHLAPHSFFKRLKAGVKYILGHKSKFGAWDEFILNKSHVPALRRVIKHLEPIQDETLKPLTDWLTNEGIPFQRQERTVTIQQKDMDAYYRAANKDPFKDMWEQGYFACTGQLSRTQNPDNVALTFHKKLPPLHEAIRSDSSPSNGREYKYPIQPLKGQGSTGKLGIWA